MRWNRVVIRLKARSLLTIGLAILPASVQAEEILLRCSSPSMGNQPGSEVTYRIDFASRTIQGIEEHFEVPIVVSPDVIRWKVLWPNTQGGIDGHRDMTLDRFTLKIHSMGYFGADKAIESDVACTVAKRQL